MKHCTACGQPLELRIPAGDDRPRHVCTACAAVHYQNPKVVVGCIVEHRAQLLLCRRAIEPAAGRWTFPCGFQELGETALEGALRETREEALAEVAGPTPFAWLDIPHIGQAYLLWRAPLRGEGFGAGDESLEARLFPGDALPWQELAFPTIRFALELWLEDRTAGRPRMHFGTVHWDRTGGRYDPASYRLVDHVALP